MIKLKKQRITCEADQLKLFCVDGLVQKSKTQFEANGTLIDDLSVKTLRDFNGSTTEMAAASTLSSYPQLNDSIDGRIHVFVAVPEGAVPGACQQIPVADLLRQNALPRDMEFTKAMEQPIGFKIPILNSTYVSMWPDTFTRGNAEYGAAIDFFLQHWIISSSEMAVVSLDYAWLTLFWSLCNCTIYQSAKGMRPHAGIVKDNVLVGMYNAKAAEKDMMTARQELTDKMAEDAYLTFPCGRTCIPAWTTCSTRIELHQLSYMPYGAAYKARRLKTYEVTDANERRDFVVDLFKILKRVISIQEPYA